LGEHADKGYEKTNPKQTQFKLEAKRRSLRVSFSESSNRGPISNAKKYVWGPQKYWQLL